MPDPRPAAAPDLHAELQSFAERLARAAGPRLLMLASYGSVARGDFKPGLSDVNVFAVFDRLDDALLDRVRPVIGDGRDALRLAPFVLSQGELRTSADAFASKFADIRLSYRVLVGEDLLADLPIRFEDLRLASEREVRNVVLRLRRAYLLGGARPELMPAALEQLLPHLFGALRVLVAHRRGVAPATLDDLLATAAADLGFDAAPLREAAQARGELGRTADLGPLYHRLFDTLAAVTCAVDALREE